MTTAFRIRSARWLLRGTGYHLRAGRKPKPPKVTRAADVRGILRDDWAPPNIVSKP
jgi:hypothetical protein